VKTESEKKIEELKHVLECLINSERILEAIECNKYLEAMENYDKLQSDYEKAKQEDRLHDAINIRNGITDTKKIIDAVSEDVIEQWKQENSRHTSLHLMGQVLVSSVGTKRALPFIEQFADTKLDVIAKTDLKKAAEILKSAEEKFKEFLPLEAIEEEQRKKELEQKKKEEEERWKREAVERKKKKKEMSNQLLNEISGKARSNSLPDVGVPIVSPKALRKKVPIEVTLESIEG